jgi:hypothetical protein
MRFGLFGSAQAARGGPDTDSGAGYREFVDRNIEAEDLGFCSTFLVKHHFTGFGQVIDPSGDTVGGHAKRDSCRVRL